MGMGGHLLRRKAPVALAAFLAAAAAHAAGTAVPAPETAAGQAAPALAEGPLPCAQGHEGVEVYSVAFPDGDIVQRTMTAFLGGRRDWLQGVLDRSERYRSFIAGELAARGLPPELRYLPAVESAYRERASSRASAVGIWQFMRGTAAAYGLRMDQWLDERRDPWKSTQASLDLLSDYNRMFKGDWPLTLAAYNCGPGRLLGIMRRYPGLDYWALRRKGVLPRETVGFVPQFLALSRIFSHPGRYGLEAGWDPVDTLEPVTLDRCVDLRILARAAGIPLAALAEANPELSFLITPPASYAYLLKVPAPYLDAVRVTLASASMPLLEFRVHVVAEGDTLSEIAQDYGVSQGLIQEFNPGLRPLALRIGAKLLVPVTPRRSS
jgi:membrane-bound lytic murein transglycosylase D